MQYYVLAQDGSRYGPADVPELSRWAGEGRLIPGSRLEEAGTGRQLLAHEIPGIVFPAAGMSQPPMGPMSAGGAQMPGYYRPQAGAYNPQSSNQLTGAWILGSVALASLFFFCCCALFTLGGVGCAIGGMVTANNAKKQGNPNAQAAWVFNLVALILCSLASAVGLLMMASMVIA
jgi:hypothetical protein